MAAATGVSCMQGRMVRGTTAGQWVYTTLMLQPLSRPIQPHTPHNRRSRNHIEKTVTVLFITITVTITTILFIIIITVLLLSLSLLLPY